jgi:hypothetical protein
MSAIKCTRLDLGSLFPTKKDAFAVVLDNVFTEEECQQLIDLTEQRGYSPALVGQQQVRVVQQRNNSRCMIDDQKLADQIYERIKDYIPTTWLGSKRLRLNERLRFLKYYPNEYFKPHNDGIYVSEDGTQCSYVTIHLYLNTVPKKDGGATTFTTAPLTYGRHVHKNHQVTNQIDSLAVHPVVGRVLIFEHHLEHEGSVLNKGVKYTMRTDVMYDITGKKSIRNSRWSSSHPHPQYEVNPCVPS